VNAPNGRRTLRIELAVESDDEIDALESALLSARAGELAEVRRRGGRLAYGYGSETARDSMDDQMRNAERRWAILDRLIGAIRAETRSKD
jgi:hypothetical protein